MSLACCAQRGKALSGREEKPPLSVEGGGSTIRTILTRGLGSESRKEKGKAACPEGKIPCRGGILANAYYSMLIGDLAIGRKGQNITVWGNEFKG